MYEQVNSKFKKCDRHVSYLAYHTNEAVTSISEYEKKHAIRKIKKIHVKYKNNI